MVALFFLSRILSSEVSLFFHKIFNSEKISIWLLSILFLPGTIIHELSHAIAAKSVFVHVGKIELVPKLYGDSLKLGSVEVGKSDVFRDFFIGIAPFITGSVLLFLILNFSFTKNLIGLNWITAIIVYLIFVISNTMYSSRKDMEGAIEFFAILLIPILIVYFFKIEIDTDFLVSLIPNKFVEYASYLLFVPIIVDVVVIAFAKLFNRKM